MSHVARVLSGKIVVWQCKTYERSPVSSVSQLPNLLNFECFFTEQAHQIKVQWQRQIPIKTAHCADD